MNKYFLALVGAACLPMTAAASSLPNLNDLIPNFIGGGFGATPDWSGAKDSIYGVAPGARVKLDQGGHIEWYGPYLGWNVSSDEHWEYGPVVNYRFGREDVDDPVIKQLEEFSGGFELGGYLAYQTYLYAGEVPIRIRASSTLLSAVSGDAEGTNLSFTFSGWLPLSRQTFLVLGVGTSLADDDFMDRRYSVSAADSAASGLPEFKAESGIRQLYGWPMVIHQINPSWFIGAGAYVQYLMNDAADNPMVDERGQRWQVTGGVGIAYAW